MTSKISFLSLKLAHRTILGLGLIFVSSLLIIGSVLAFSPFENNFNSPEYYVGNLDTQNSWTKRETDNQTFQVVDDVYYEGNQGVGYFCDGVHDNLISKIGDTSATGTITFWTKSNDTLNTTGYLGLCWENCTYMHAYAGIVLGVVRLGGINGPDPYGWKNFKSAVNNTWYKIQIEWAPTNQIRGQVDDEGWSDWYISTTGWTYLNGLAIYGGNPEIADVYYDNVYSIPPVPPFRIWGIDPVSETEITSTSTSFTFGYEGFATDTWNGILVNFCEKTTGICATEKVYPKALLSASGGTKTINLDDFGIDRNGDWDLIGDGYFGFLSEDFEWLTGFTGDVVDPDYYLIFNVSGLPAIFELTPFETWYSEHSEYATATANFIAIAGFLEPYFSKIGEFGSRINTLFNQGEAYSRGANLGQAISTFSSIIDDMDFLIGGFPLVNFFLIACGLLMGFFLFKLIWKLIRG